MNQMAFDLDQALEARDEGMKRVEENNERFLKEARRVARVIASALPDHEVTADDVRHNCCLEPLHHNAWGPLFMTKDWEWTGKYRRSALVQGHGNPQKVWRLKER